MEPKDLNDYLECMQNMLERSVDDIQADDIPGACFRMGAVANMLHKLKVKILENE